MGLIDSLKNMLGKNKVEEAQNHLLEVADQNNDGKLDTADLGAIKDQATNLLDRNNDGDVNSTDLNEITSVADLNQDGAVNQEDLQAAKDKISS